jgi:stearoyl-CoA desaturase (delta-9 desaturase)
MNETLRASIARTEQGDLSYAVCTQFLLLHLACLLAFWTGVSAAAVAVCLSLYVVRMFAITAGFHRLFSHRSYRTGRLFQFLLAFVGTTSYQKGPLWWSAHHRRHHLHVDTEEDLHSPVMRSVWQSHVGWFLSRVLPPLMLAASTYVLGVLLGRYFPGSGTSGGQMLVWGFFVSTVLLYHGTFTVNSAAHLFGSRRFETADNSRNNFLVALITLGEGWHNNHHHYPSSERQGLYWWEIDFSHYTLRALSLVGVVSDLKKPPAR